VQLPDFPAWRKTTGGVRVPKKQEIAKPAQCAFKEKRGVPVGGEAIHPNFNGQNKRLASRKSALNSGGSLFLQAADRGPRWKGIRVKGDSWSGGSRRIKKIPRFEARLAIQDADWPAALIR